jgi:hypothetical protein
MSRWGVGYKMFYYEFSNGEKKLFKQDDAQKYADEKGILITMDASKRHQYRVMTKDGFQPGFCYGTGKYFGGPREKAKWLARNRMEEMGKEKIPCREKEAKIFTEDSLAGMIKETGAKIDGVMADHLIKKGPVDFVEAPEDMERPTESGGYADDIVKI